MKPLSPANYFRNNRRSFISSVIAITLSISLVYGLNCFLDSIYKTAYVTQLNFYEKCSSITHAAKASAIPDSIVKQIKESQYVDRLIPVEKLYIRFTSIGNMTELPIYGTTEEDRQYIIEKYNLRLIEGSYPAADKKEISLDSRVALNNKLTLGDIYQDYKITGLLKSDYYISFSSAASDFNKRQIASAFIFPKKDLENEANKLLASFSNEEVNYKNLGILNQEFLNDTGSSRQLFDAITILVIIVSVVTLACTKYTQFMNRKSEYGILNSLGYSRQEIMKLTLKEVLQLNLYSFAVGIIIGAAVSYFLTKAAFSSTGGIMVFISLKGFLLSLLTPLFSAIFTLIPIFRQLSHIDGITMIEEV